MAGTRLPFFSLDYRCQTMGDEQEGQVEFSLVNSANLDDTKPYIYCPLLAL